MMADVCPPRARVQILLDGHAARVPLAAVDCRELAAVVDAHKARNVDGVIGAQVQDDPLGHVRGGARTLDDRTLAAVGDGHAFLLSKCHCPSRLGLPNSRIAVRPCARVW